MDDNQFWEELTAIFRRVFSDQSIVIKPETTAADMSQWDSLSHIQLILAVEQHFGIRFSNTEVSSFDNVGDLMAAIKRHKSGQA